MPTIEPIYSIEKGCEVYHNHTECTERNNIEARNIRAGSGSKRLCDHCKRLSHVDAVRPIVGLGGGLLGGLSSLIKAKK
jgi:hypothetical protein